MWITLFCLTVSCNLFTFRDCIERSRSHNIIIWYDWHNSELHWFCQQYFENSQHEYWYWQLRQQTSSIYKLDLFLPASQHDYIPTVRFWSIHWVQLFYWQCRDVCVLLFQAYIKVMLNYICTVIFLDRTWGFNFLYSPIVMTRNVMT
jgi:hypothetical protein